VRKQHNAEERSERQKRAADGGQGREAGQQVHADGQWSTFTVVLGHLPTVAGVEKGLTACVEKYV
jgi:hypothetical protein